MTQLDALKEPAAARADPHTVRALLRDGAFLPGPGPPFPSFFSSRAAGGEGRAPEGVGAVRVSRSGKPAGRDPMSELVPDRRLAYPHVSSLPMKNFHAQHRPRARRGRPRDPLGVAVRPRVPGPDKLMRKGLDSYIAGMTDGLAEWASKTASTPSRYEHHRLRTRPRARASTDRSTSSSVVFQLRDREADAAAAAPGRAARIARASACAAAIVASVAASSQATPAPG